MAIKLRSQADDSRDDTYFEAPPIIRFDERRMHVRAYNYWTSLLGDKRLPSIEDLDPADIRDFGAYSVLLDFSAGTENPAIIFLGGALATQCDIDGPISRVDQVPPRTLLSRLTDHYLQIVANAAPISFEAEFTNQRGAEILYRGIMMPFSSDGETIDFVYGVISWKEVASDALMDSIAAEVEATLAHAASKASPTPIWADGPSAPPPASTILDLTDLMIDEDESDDIVTETGEDEALVDHLAAAREAASIAVSAEGRGRQALYRAVGLAHAFALMAQARRADYIELLADAGLAESERHPIATLVRLVFGADYDKTRMAEFARAIEHAIETHVEAGQLAALLGSEPGGLKAYVAKARALARNGKNTDRPSAVTRARQRLAEVAPVPLDDLSFDETALAVVVVRQAPDGSLLVLGGLSPEDRLSERVLESLAAAR